MGIENCIFGNYSNNSVLYLTDSDWGTLYSSSGISYQRANINICNSVFDSSIGTENVISLDFICDVNISENGNTIDNITDVQSRFLMGASVVKSLVI